MGIFEGDADGGAFAGFAVREVGDGAVFDLAVFAEGLAEKEAAVLAVAGGLVNIHEHKYTDKTRQCKQ